jgi:hypothetical protein
MRAMNIPLPRAALTRLVCQSARPSELQSCQADLTMTVRNYTDTATYLATPGNQYYVSITDVDNILPWTLLRINIGVTPVTPSGWSAYAAVLWVTAADTTPALAAARLASQLNLYAQTMVSWGYKAFKSMRAAANGMDLHIWMPWGMLGLLDYDTDGPDGSEAVVVGFPGVDHPLWFSLLGPRRHCLRVLPTYPGPYYGDPIG